MAEFLQKSAQKMPACGNNLSKKYNVCQSDQMVNKTFIMTYSKGQLVFSVIDLIYWRDVKKTGIVFGSMMVLLLSLALFSVLSVVAYLSLAALTVTCSFRVYKNILQAVQKTGEGHPFKQVFVLPTLLVKVISDS